MYNYRVTATVFGDTVQWDTPAGTIAEAANLFIRAIRFTSVSEIPDSGGEDGLKGYEVTARIGEDEHTGTVRSAEIFQPIYQNVSTITGVAELGPIEPPAA